MIPKNNTIDYGKGCVLQLEHDRDAVIITLSKELIKKAKIVFEDTCIPGVIGPNFYVDAQEVADRYMEYYQCLSCAHNKKGLCSHFGGLVLGSIRVGKGLSWESSKRGKVND